MANAWRTYLTGALVTILAWCLPAAGHCAPPADDEVLQLEELAQPAEATDSLAVELPGITLDAPAATEAPATLPEATADTLRTAQPTAVAQPADAPVIPTQRLSRKDLRRQRKAAKNAPLDLPEFRRDAYRISAGQKRDVYANTDIVFSADSLRTVVRDTAALSLPCRDSLALNTADSLASTDTLALASLSRREQRALKRMQLRADTTLYRHSPLFRDTLKIAPLTAISAVVPGFGQLYNGDYWKIPVLYATTGTALYFGIQQHQQYVKYKNEYEYLLSRTDFSDNRNLLDPVQTKMIQHNTWQQVFFGAAVASYLYFLGDAIINYPASEANPVKTATTLSMICPGAGQIYNGSYWKMPLVVGGFATFIYVIDWNNRGYQRYTRAIRLETDSDPDTHSDEFWNSQTGKLTMSVDQMKSYQKSYRRNRDLAIILTAAFYLLNVMDAHVDAHMKDFDVGDNLACRIRLQPTMEPLYAMVGGGYSFGLGLSFTF